MNFISYPIHLFTLHFPILFPGAGYWVLGAGYTRFVILSFLRPIVPLKPPPGFATAGGVIVPSFHRSIFPLPFLIFNF